MICTEEDEDGHVLGSVVCGNTQCQKVLYTYEGEENEPGPDESAYRLFSVQARVLYVDDYGRPLRGMPPGNPFEVLGVGLLSSQDDRVVGYRITPGSMMMGEDFCSDRCASQYLDDRKEYSLCFRAQPDGSLTFVTQRTERFPTDQVQVRLASASASASQPQTAAGDYQGRPEPYIARGESYVQQGRMNEAVGEFEAALRVDPNNADAHQKLGVAYTKLGREAEAMREYEAAVRIDPRHSKARFDLGLAYERMGFWKDAAVQFEASLDGEPSRAKAHLHLGEAYRHMGALEEAVREYEAALRIEPTLSKAVKAHASARTEAASEQGHIEYYGRRLELFRALVAYEAGQARPMMTHMTTMFIACPMGQPARDSGEYKHCGRGLEIPLGLAPCAVLCPFCFSLFFVDAEQNSPEYADADLNLTVTQGPALIGYAATPDHRAHGRLHSRIAKRTSGGCVLIAAPLADETMQMFHLSPNSPSIAVIPGAPTLQDLANGLRAPSVLANFVLESALAAYAEGRYWETVGLAQRAMVICPESARAHHILADALDELGTLEAAVGEYQEALRLDPGFSMTYNNLGLVYNKLGRTKDAAQAYQVALRIDPDNVDARLSLANLYMGLRRWDDAAAEYQAVVRMQPDHGIAHYNLGIAYLQLRRFDQAVRELQAAARLMPDDGETHGNLGQAYLQQGRTGDAVREWQTAVRLGYAPAKQWLAQAGRR